MDKLIFLTRRAQALLALIAMLSAGSLGGCTSDSARVEVAAAVPRGELKDDEMATIDIFKRTSPSVVFITRIVRRSNPFTLNAFDMPQGSGSGFLWSEEGHIVTNFHVVAQGDAFQVTLADRSTHRADIVGAAPDKDLAVLKLANPPANLQPIKVGSSDDLQVGQEVLAIGNPFGLDHTLTTGVVSALGREIQSLTKRTIQDVIQTDAAINPGNSGGPLLDSAGRLIGVNTAIFSPSGSSAGIGFAIPVDTVRRVVPQLVTRGRITRPGIGVEIVPDSLTQRFGLQGVMISRVPPSSPAQQAGLRGVRRSPMGDFHPGDVITAVNTTKIDKNDDLLNILEKHQAGDTIELTISRQGQERKVSITLIPLE